ALLEEKRQLVNRVGLIEYLPSATGIEQIGGLEIMKKWLLERRKLFEMRDAVGAEIVPKGVLVMGISGCGKSLCIKAIASCFVLRRAARSLRHVRYLLWPPGAGGEPLRAGLPPPRVDLSRRGVVRRDRGRDQYAGQGGRAGPHLRVLPHLDAGEDPRPLRRRHGQPHRPAARRDDPQGTLRRGVLRRPAARRGAPRHRARASE